MDTRQIARKWALKNAADHGNAIPDALLGKVIGEAPETKKDVPALRSLLAEVSAEVNALSKEQLLSELAAFSFEEKKQRDDLPPLDLKSVITRVAPNPSGYLHIGHAKNLVLCDEYAKRYDGKLILRLEDTDPKTKKPMPEAYTAIPEDAKWLGCSISRVVVQSERIPIYYEHAEKLIEAGHAYVCSCTPEKMQDNRAKGVACGCRAQTPVQAMREWKNMLLRVKEGKATLRIKTDMQHPNASIRDWPAMRVVEEEHPKTGKKYRVWPLYNFAAPLDDHLLGITLVLRGKEHELNAEKQKYVYDYFGWKEPRVMEYGLLHIEGAMSHKSEIMEGIKEGKFTGWDDYRLPTLRGLRKRGIQPGTIRKYMISLGVKPTDSTLDWDILFKLNRLELKDTDHYYFVTDPVRLDVGAGSKTIELQKNPTEKRQVQTGPAAYICKSDAETFTGQTVRLKDWINADLPSGKASANQDHHVPKIQWVCDPVIEVKVYKPDGVVDSGIAENAVSQIKQGAVVQFERYGFCRYDREEDGVKIFYFAHP